jgi:LmbE family N-acetylglucosaminyl deacetylase
LLVVAPHPDDDILAAGGLIHRAVRRGSAVRVAFMTIGDGYMLAAARLAGVVDPGPEDYVALGGHRRDEAVAALASLGVGERSVVFLGYPDQGTARILDGGHWGPGEPYRSRYTERDACPYPFVLTPGAPYCGQQIVSDVIRVIQGFWPDVILLPHPADTHDDHWATYAWWLYALERMDYVSATGAEVVCYMVHSGLDWPAPWGYQPDEQLRPPEGRAQPAMMWMRVDLEEEERVAKLRALEQHRSQMGLSGPFLKSFVRANELFCLVPGFDVVGDGADGGARPIAGPGGSGGGGALEPGPVHGFPRVFPPGGEIRSTVVSRADEGLLVTMELGWRPSASIDYQLRVAPCSGHGKEGSIVDPLVYRPFWPEGLARAVRREGVEDSEDREDLEEEGWPDEPEWPEEEDLQELAASRGLRGFEGLEGSGVAGVADLEDMRALTWQIKFLVPWDEVGPLGSRTLLMETATVKRGRILDRSGWFVVRTGRAGRREVVFDSGQAEVNRNGIQSDRDP